MVTLIVIYVLIRVLIQPIFKHIKFKRHLNNVYTVYPLNKYQQIYRKVKREEDALEHELEMWLFIEKNKHLKLEDSYQKFINYKRQKVSNFKLEKLNMLDYLIIFLLLIVNL